MNTTPPSGVRQRGGSRFALLLILGSFIGFGALTALFWSQIWWGNRLDDGELAAYLDPDAGTREQKHAVEELSRRFEERTPGNDRWADGLVTLSREAHPTVQASCAWVMQYDAARPEFRGRLVEMVADDDAMVRRNAATSLAVAGDATGRPVLRSMLQPVVVVAPVAGELTRILAPGQPVREGVTLARVEPGGEAEPVELRAEVPGTVKDGVPEPGTQVEPGVVLLEIAPAVDHVRNAVAALLLVGTAEDVDLLRAVAAPAAGYDNEVRALATRAVDRIQGERPASQPR